jgi:hypothetical protein
MSAGIVAAVALSLLVTASCLAPSASGHGTHLALGLPPCGFLAAFGKPCPTCGMTTAFARATHGDLAGAFAAQWFGASLAIVSASAFWAGGYIAITGSMLGRAFTPLLRPAVMWMVAACFLAAWAFAMAGWKG